MRFMVIVKASPESEAGELPSEELLAAMGAYLSLIHISEPTRPY